MHTVIDLIKGIVGQIMKFNCVYTFESVKQKIIKRDKVEITRCEKNKRKTVFVYV